MRLLHGEYQLECTQRRVGLDIMRWTALMFAMVSAAFATAGCGRDNASGRHATVERPDPRTALAGSDYEWECGSQACQRDCSAHEEGFKGAALYGGVSESECAGRSSSFEEGCVAFTRELRRREAVAASAHVRDKH